MDLIKNFFIILVISIIPIFSFVFYINKDVYINYNDNSYVFSDIKKPMLAISTWNPNYLGYDQSLSQFNFFPKSYINYLLSHLIPDKIVNFTYTLVLIFFSLFGLYILTRDFFQKQIDFYLAILLFLTSNFAIEYYLFGAFYVFPAYLQIILILYIFLGDLHYKKSIKLSIIAGTISFFSQPLFLLISSSVGAFLLIFNRDKYKQFIIFNSISVVSFPSILNFLTKFIFNTQHLSSDMLDKTFEMKNVLGVFLGMTQSLTLNRVLAFNHYYGNYSDKLLPSWIYVSGFITILLLVIYFINKKNDRVYNSELAVFAFFLSIVSLPSFFIIKNLIVKLFEIIPFLGFLRTYARFEVVLLGLLFYVWAKYYSNFVSYKLRILLFIFLLIKFVFISYYVSGYQTRFAINNEYIEANNLLNIRSCNNLLALPNISYEVYDWALNDKYQKFTQDYYFQDIFFDCNVSYSRISKTLPKQMLDFIASYDLANLREYSDFTHILLHKDYYHSNDYTKMIDYLDDNIYISKIYSGDQIDVYEFKYPLPSLIRTNNMQDILYTTNSYYRYDISLEKILSKNNVHIQFLQTFDFNWLLFPGSNFSWWKAPFLKPIADKNHYVEYGYANAWNLSQEDLDRARNEKGDVELVLYFLPQTYFYYGLTISLSTLFGLVCYILYKFVNKS